jgi:hypothetical protein
MPITLSVTAVTTVQVTFALVGEAADGTNQFQIAVRPDFQYCVCPLIPIARGTPRAVSRLNFGTTYYARVRSLRASGVAEAWSNVVAFRMVAGGAWNTAPAAVMIEPALLVVPTPVIEWGSTSVVAGFPVSNLGYDAPNAFRGLSQPMDITARMAPEPIDTIAILNTNVGEAGTIQVFAGTTNATADYDSGVVPFRVSANLPGRPGYHGLVRLAAAQSYEYWKVRISHLNTANLIHIEHMIFGKNRLSKNHSFDKNETGLDLGSLERTRSGNPNRVDGYRMRRVDFDISMMSEAQYETQYGDLQWRVGGTSPVLCAPNSKAGAFLHDRLLYGAISAGRVVNPATPAYTRNFTIDSLI